MAEDNVEIQKAAELAEKGNPAWDVRHWFHQAGHGTLATVSARKNVAGFPLGSIVPFALDKQGRPLILIAGIAAHTRNLKADNRASLFVHDPATTGDPQKSWRASVMGCFKEMIPTRERQDESPLAEYSVEVTDGEWDEMMARYSQRVPDARGYMRTHGFSFWRMEIEAIRYIAGFGRICWVDGESYLNTIQAHSFTQMEEGAMAHMNDDHVENMKEMCRGHYHLDPSQVSMVGLDIGGCLLQTESPDGLHHFPFQDLVEKPEDYKTQIIASLRQARTVARPQTG